MSHPTAATLTMAALLAQAGASPALPPAQPAPSTDIYVASIAAKGDVLTIGTPENISKSPGYDNQPFFTPDGRSLLFTSDRGPRVSAPPTPRRWDQPIDHKWPPGSLQPSTARAIWLPPVPMHT